MMRGNRVMHVATWMFSRLVPESEREPLVGDLMEEYALRADAASPAAASRWYVGQICASAPPLLWCRLTRGAWISTLGVALLAYVAVGIVEFAVNWALSGSPTAGAVDSNAVYLVIMFPAVILIAYFAARFRRGASGALATMMLLAVTAMTVWGSESVPLWYRVAYFFVGPAAAFIGGALRSRQLARP